MRKREESLKDLWDNTKWSNNCHNSSCGRGETVFPPPPKFEEFMADQWLPRFEVREEFGQKDSKKASLA